MLHKKTIPWHTVWRFTALFFCYLLLPACNNEKSGEDKKVVTDSTVKSTDTTSSVESFDGNFKYLTITKKDLKDLFEKAPFIEKVVFKFQFESPVGYPSLVGYGATSVRKFKDTKPLITLTRTGFKVNLTGELYLGNLEMTRAEFDELFKPGSGHENSTYLIFSPKISSQYKGNVIFGLSWDKGNALTDEYLKTLNFDDEELNPSPPAKPEGSEEP